jgi:hypothetical protein
MAQKKIFQDYLFDGVSSISGVTSLHLTQDATLNDQAVRLGQLTSAISGVTLSETLSAGHNSGANNIFMEDSRLIYFGSEDDTDDGHSIMGEAGGALVITASDEFNVNSLASMSLIGEVVQLASTKTNGASVEVGEGSTVFGSGGLPVTTIELHSTSTRKLKLQNTVLTAPQTQTFQDETGIIALVGDNQYTETVNLVAATPTIVTHNLGSTVIHVQLWDSTGAIPNVTVTRNNVNSVTLLSTTTVNNIECNIIAHG